jgi:hypothetical protein
MVGRWDDVGLVRTVTNGVCHGVVLFVVRQDNNRTGGPFHGRLFFYPCRYPLQESRNGVPLFMFAMKLRGWIPDQNRFGNDIVGSGGRIALIRSHKKRPALFKPPAILLLYGVERGCPLSTITKQCLVGYRADRSIATSGLTYRCSCLL